MRTREHANRSYSYRRRLAIWFGVLALVAAACGGAEEDTAAPTTAAPTTAAPTTAAPTTAAPTSQRPDGVPAPGESETLDRIYNNGEFVGGCAPTTPHCIIDPSINEWVGLGPSIAELLAERLGVRYRTVGAGWDAIVPGLATGKYDMIVTGLTFRPERAESVDYELLGSYGFCVLARADDDRVQSWESFAENPELRLGQIAGVAEEAMIRSDFPTINLVSMQSTRPSLSEEVSTGRIDGTLMGSISIPLEMEVYPNLKVIPEDCFEAPILGQPWGMAVPKGDTVMLEWFGAVVEELKADGTWDDLIAYWYAPEQLRLGIEG